MKAHIRSGILIVALALCSPPILQAQGTVYLSSLEQLSSGSDACGSDSWLAIDFVMGNYFPPISGYALNSVQLEMTDAIGSPSGLTVQIFPVSGNFPAGSPNLGSSLGTLIGPVNPSTAGIYTYVPVASITVLPNTQYFIVLTSATVVADGDYELSESTSYATVNNNWYGGGGLYSNDNGLSWGVEGTYFQFALTATAVPEPTSAFLLLLGSGVLIYIRNSRRRSISR